MLKVNLFKKIKTPKMFLRLQKIAKYFFFTDIQDDKISIMFKDIYLKDASLGMLICNFAFKTYLGEVQIKLTYDELFDLIPICNVEYITYAGTNLFSLYSSKNSLKVSPNLGELDTINAKDIDLAILELEEHLQTQYGNLKELEENYLNIKKAHEQQVSLLW